MLICTIKCTDKCKEIIKLSQQCIGNMTDIFNNQGNKLLESITQKLEKEETFYFEPYKRLNIEQTPTLFCDNGEKTQDSKIYPITADEVVFASAKSDETNNNFYLADNLTNYGTNTVTIYGWDLAPFSQIYYLYNRRCIYNKLSTFN